MSPIEPVRVFVSYKKDDVVGDGEGRKFVKLLRLAVEESARAQGVPIPDVWYDDDIQSGADWENVIKARIEGAEVMVLVYTPEFFASEGFIAKNELPRIVRRLDGIQLVQVVRRTVLPNTGFFQTTVIPPALRKRDPEHDGHAFDGLPSEDFNARLALTADNIVAASVRAYAARQTTLVRPALADFLVSVADRQPGLDRANPEDQLKYPVQALMNEAAPLLSGRQLTTRTEDPIGAEDPVQHVRLDVAVLDSSSGYRIGHIELKAPHKGADPTKKNGRGNWSDHDVRQWRKLKEHPNLIYCNGFEWTLLRHGVRIDTVSMSESGNGPTDEDVASFTRLVGNFVSWRPSAPRSARALAQRLAPLARLLREAVSEHIVAARNSHDPSRSRLVNLHDTWRQTLVPDATDEDFADSVAQTFTYALLLARLNDRIALPVDADEVASSLKGHGHVLLGSVLDMLANPQVRKHIDGEVGLIETAIAAVDPEKLSSRKETWLYFYEDFLAEYDPKLRRDAGVYYTPVEVVGVQVRLVEDVLKTRLERELGFGDSRVRVLDPATGTGTYLLSTAEHVLAETARSANVKGRSEEAAAAVIRKRVADAAESLKSRLFGFELLIGAYSVAHLRLSQMLSTAGANLEEHGVRVYLTDTLTAPREGHGSLAAPPLFWNETQAAIVAEQREADAVKSDHEKITVIMGNPPWNRSSKLDGQGAGGDDTRNIVLNGSGSGSRRLPPLIDAFREPVVTAGNGRMLKHNLNDPYIYFLRWAIWKATEQDPTDPAVVSFISNSSYLRSAPFAGVREHMRRQFDEIWILDLGGSGRGARKEENVFHIQTSAAICVCVQYPLSSKSRREVDAHRRRSAIVRYRRIHGTTDDKLESLNLINNLNADDPAWILVNDESSKDFAGKFVPAGVSDFHRLPTLDQVLPWANSGVQYARTWPVAPDRGSLLVRWDNLFVSGGPDPEKFQEGSGMTVSSIRRDPLTGETPPALATPGAVASVKEPVRYGFRSFDRMMCLPDVRLCHRMRAPLWNSYGPKQIFLATQMSTSNVLGTGPAVTVSAHVPDLHYFAGKGEKDILPLWRDADATEANVNGALLSALGASISAQDIFTYVVGLLGTSAYTERFYGDLAESAPRVPITKNTALFQEVACFGRALIAVQTYGERFSTAVPSDFGGSAVIERSPAEGEYPASYRYDEEKQTLALGEGRVSQVSPEVWDFEVSGLKVVASWLGYRLATKKGRKGPLDNIRSESWIFDDELVDLLWAVEYVVKASEVGEALLDRVLASEVFTTNDMPAAAAIERIAPAGRYALFDSRIQD